MTQEHDVTSQKLWALIEANALLAQKHTKWDLYLIRIKVLVEMIEGRMERFKGKERCGQRVQGPKALDKNINKEVNQHES